MASLTVESTSTGSATTDTDVTATKPTGLAVGDLMVAVMYANGSSWNIASGWTDVETHNSGAAAISIQRKIADSSDVLASDFTFSLNSSQDELQLVIFRISNVDATNTVPDSNGVAVANVQSNPLTYTVNTDPGTDNCLIIYAIGLTGGTTVSGITTTPSASVTTVLDAESAVFAFSVGYQIQTVETQVTAFRATFGNDSGPRAGYANVVVRPNHPSSGTTELFEPDIEFIAPTASSGTTGTNTLLEPNTELLTTSGSGNSPTKWTNEADVSTDWTNESSL